jgi:hypothetical protein
VWVLLMPPTLQQQPGVRQALLLLLLLMVVVVELSLRCCLSCLLQLLQRDRCRVVVWLLVLARSKKLVRSKGQVLSVVPVVPVTTGPLP